MASITGNSYYRCDLYSVFTVQFWEDFTNGPLYCEAFHQAFKLIRRKLPCFISGLWPLEVIAGGQSFGEDHIAIAFKYKTAASVSLCSTEKEERSFFQRIQPIVQPDVSGKAVDSFSQIDATATDDNLVETNSIPKHG